MNSERFAAVLFVVNALLVMAIGLLTRDSLPLLQSVGKILGEMIFLSGMALFVWAALSLKEAFRGTVAPVTDHLIRTGPYRWLRHPLYLSMLVTLLGFAVALKSLWGLLAVPVLFGSAVVHRAKLEEQALQQRFGKEWESYAARTWFLFPSF